MTDKQKEAIEYLKKRNEKYQSHKEQIDLVTDIYGIDGVKEYHKKQEAIETVLNLVQSQQEELEKLNSIVKIDDITSNCNVELIEELKAELEKKDKIIDLMAEEIVKAHEWFYSEFDNYTKEDFKQYFENKVKESK